MRVKNINGTSDSKAYGYDSWKDFWIAKSGQLWPYYCVVYGCMERAVLGAHVKKVGSNDNSWYIIPACSHHNNDKDAEFDVPESMMVKIY